MGDGPGDGSGWGTGTLPYARVATQVACLVPAAENVLAEVDKVRTPYGTEEKASVSVPDSQPMQILSVR